MLQRAAQASHARHWNDNKAIQYTHDQLKPPPYRNEALAATVTAFVAVLEVWQGTRRNPG